MCECVGAVCLFHKGRIANYDRPGPRPVERSRCDAHTGGPTYLVVVARPSYVLLLALETETLGKLCHTTQPGFSRPFLSETKPKEFNILLLLASCSKFGVWRIQGLKSINPTPLKIQRSRLCMVLGARLLPSHSSLVASNE